MDATQVIQFIDAEIARLEQAKTLLNGHTVPAKRGRPIGFTSYSHLQANSQEDYLGGTGTDSSSPKGEMGKDEERLKLIRTL
jgi:hypothetical protein